jgi:hypothetical protein
MRLLLLAFGFLDEGEAFGREDCWREISERGK